MSDSTHFDASLDQLLDELPAHLAHRRPGSELAVLLAAWSEPVDELADVFESLHADQALATASDEALRGEYAVLYGAQNESLAALGTDQLRGYLQARASEDGRTSTLIQTLLAILRTPANATGTPLTLPATFPPDGSGLPLFQSSPDAATVTSLHFPGDGSGLPFPADGSGLTFPNQPGRLEVFERLSDSRIDVYVRGFLAFDRGAFARAVARFRPAHFFPSTVTETPTPQTS